MAGRCAEILKAIAALFPPETGVAYSKVTYESVADCPVTPAVLVRHGPRPVNSIDPDRQADYLYQPYLDIVIGPDAVAAASDVGTALVAFEEMVMAVLARSNMLKNRSEETVAQSLKVTAIEPQGPVEAAEKQFSRVSLRVKYMDDYNEKEPLKEIQTFKFTLRRLDINGDTIADEDVDIDATAM
jgi:hypothetical protein